MLKDLVKDEQAGMEISRLFYSDQNNQSSVKTFLFAIDKDQVKLSFLL